MIRSTASGQVRKRTTSGCEGYTYGLTPGRQRHRCVVSGFWSAGNPVLVEKLLEVGYLLLEYPSSVFTGSLPSGGECQKIQLGG